MPASLDIIAVISFLFTERLLSFLLIQNLFYVKWIKEQCQEKVGKRFLARRVKNADRKLMGIQEMTQSPWSVEKAC